MISDSPLDFIFRTSFYRLRGFAGCTDVILKIEGFSVTGSIKIKTALGLVSDFESRQMAEPERTTLVESSSGNLGIALSLVCAIKGYKFICVTDPTATTATVRGMRAYGAEVVIVHQRDDKGGYLGTRLAEIERILATNREAIWLNQYANPANTAVHARETANEILDSVPDVDWVFLGTGTLGTLTGVAKRLRRCRPAARIVAVEPTGSVTFGGTPARRTIPGIGASVRPPLADAAAPDEIIYVDEADTIRTCHDFVRAYHLLVGASTGTVLAGIRSMIDRFRPGDTIVAVSPDLGEKYLDTIYDEAWVAQHLGADVALDR